MARQQQDVDELFDVKNAFYVGNYQQAINEAQSVSPSTPLIALQRDAFLYRSYIAQGNHRIVLQELKTADPMLQPLKTLVEYLTPNANKPAIVADIDARVAKGTELSNEIFLIVAATIYYHEDNYEAALKIPYRKGEKRNLYRITLLSVADEAFHEAQPNEAQPDEAQLKYSTKHNFVLQINSVCLSRPFISETRGVIEFENRPAIP